jgi:uncharacterized OB-fold protein
MGFEKFGWVTFLSQTRVAKFVEFLQEGKIYGTKCKECGAIQFPPRAHCLRCLSSNFEWSHLSGSCTLITYAKVEAAPAAFQDQAPYILGLAELAEGPKVFAWIKSVAEGHISPGMKMRLKTIKLSNGNWTYVLSEPSSI